MNAIRSGLLAAGAAAALALAACSSSSDSGNAGGSATPDQPSTGATVASGKTVPVELSEFHIMLASTTFDAGTYTFAVHNDGDITHALSIDGPGVDDASTGDMSGGASKRLTVTLETGSYDVYCPVGDHKMEGMDETVTVR